MKEVVIVENEDGLYTVYYDLGEAFEQVTKCDIIDAEVCANNVPVPVRWVYREDRGVYKGLLSTLRRCESCM